MQPVGDQLFPCSAFANDKHGFIQRRQMGNLLQHFKKAVGFAEKVIFVFCHDEIHHLLVLFTTLAYFSREVKLYIVLIINILKSWHADCINPVAGHSPISEHTV